MFLTVVYRILSINKYLIMMENMTEKQTWILGIVGGFSLLYLTKKYFAGGVCKIRKDLSGKVAIITGGNTGIGKATAKQLVEMGCLVIIGARDSNKNKATTDELNSLKKGEAIAFQLDLSKRDSIDEFCIKVKNVLRGRPINYLINNSGTIMVKNHTKTAEGAEIQMGVNHLGHFLLTYSLWKELKEAGNPRIINVSSGAHVWRSQICHINFDDLGFERDPYSPVAAYSRSKKANILFTKQLQKKMDSANMNGISLSLHPGVVRTQSARQIVNTAFKRIVFNFIMGLFSLFIKSCHEGAQTTLYTLLEDQQKLQKGGYYADCKKRAIETDQCRNPWSATKLWDVSEQYWGIKFDV